jgi:Homeodomain-like domain-containing protein
MYSFYYELTLIFSIVVTGGSMNIDKKYDANYHPTKFGELILAGFTARQICKKLGIHHSTYYDWKKNKPAITDTIRRSREVLANDLEPFLLKRAKGFYYSESTSIPQTTGTGANMKTEIVIVKQIRKYMPPDVAALKYFLKNMLPGEWSDRTNVQHDISEDSGIVVLTGKVTLEQWEAEHESPES